MRTNGNLRKLRDNYYKRLNRFEKRFDYALYADPSHNSKECLSYCVIELMNSYRAFNRALLASSMLGAKTVLGNYTKYPGVNNEFDFIFQVFTVLKKRCDVNRRTWDSRDEPAWEAQVDYLANYFNLANAPSINTAYTSSGFYKEMKVFRNYCCHRSHLLYEDVRTVSIQYLIADKTIEMMLLQQKNNGRLIYTDWIDNCRCYADMATQ